MFQLRCSPRSLLIAAAALAALAVAGPALAFDPQPDPPIAIWDAVLRIWRLFRG
jgi:hypothetical protein